MNESWFLSFKLNTDPVMNYLDSRLGYKTNFDLPVPGTYGHHWTVRDCYTIASYVALPCCRSLNMRSSCPKHSTPHQLKWTKASQNYYQVEKHPRGNNKPNWTNCCEDWRALRTISFFNACPIYEVTKSSWPQTGGNDNMTGMRKRDFHSSFSPFPTNLSFYFPFPRW